MSLCGESLNYQGLRASLALECLGHMFYDARLYAEDSDPGGYRDYGPLRGTRNTGFVQFYLPFEQCGLSQVSEQAGFEPNGPGFVGLLGWALRYWRRVSHLAAKSPGVCNLKY